MEIKLAKNAGFCFGVEKAIDKVYEQIKKTDKIYTYGPIIHNEEVISDLEKKGVTIINNTEELKKIAQGTVIIRSHGVTKKIYELIEEQGLECVDATCPFVTRIHKLVDKESKEGKHIIIIGNQGHPEVEGIIGWCNGNMTVIENEQEAEEFQLSEGKNIFIIAQTTYNYKKFQYIVEIFNKKGYNSSVVNTICNATEDRQAEARAIAAEADMMIVIGGKHSSNTQKLYEICSGVCENTYFIQTLDDLHLDPPKAVRLVGITAGASTPNKLIEEVQNYVRINF